MSGELQIDERQCEVVLDELEAVDEFLRRNENYRIRVQSGIAVLKLKI